MGQHPQLSLGKLSSLCKNKKEVEGPLMLVVLLFGLGSS